MQLLIGRCALDSARVAREGGLRRSDVVVSLFEELFPLKITHV